MARVPILLVLLAGAAAAAAQDPPAYIERVDVVRVLVDARVTDGRGDPIRGLGPDDFRVRIDGRRARVESAQWVQGALAATSVDAAAPAGVTRDVAAAEGRLIVLLFQKDLEPSRILGLMRMLIEAREFLDTLTPSDRVAVLSFDSRLRLWLDFTGDVDRVREVLAGLLRGRPRAVTAGDPSLLEFVERVAPRTASVEEALHVVGAALEPLPGAKTVVLIGHGFGRLGLSGVTLGADYDEAGRVLQRARAAVFCLDVTQADAHSLEAGLKTVAAETGGFFARTHIFPTQAIRRLAATIAGHYVLIVEAPPGRAGRRRIDVDLVGRPGTVLARSSFDQQERTFGPARPDVQ